VEVEKRDIAYGHSEQVFINIYAIAKSFLWHQVRKMVAAVVSVGEGNLSLTELQTIIDAKDPEKCPPLAPAQGLYFLEAKYDPYTIQNASTTKFTKKQNLEETKEEEQEERAKKKQKI